MATATATTTTRPNNNPVDDFPEDSIPNEAPPAYTPSPAFGRGEQSIEYGPSRPFQAAPSRPVPVNQGFQQGWGGGYGNLPGHHHGGGYQPNYNGGHGYGPAPGPSNFSPPPGPPPQSASQPALSSSSSAASAGNSGKNHGPPRHPSLSVNAGPSSSSQAGPSSPTPQPPRQTYEPSSTPRPGQPYLNNGRLLVYPVGYECWKCQNTGYKNYDPGHPCRKCWEKYGRPYTGALRLAPSDTPASNFQRPLRTFPPARTSQQFSGYPGAYPQQMVSAGQPAPVAYGPPPPGALVVQPGDPRIGGRPCWNCGGDGIKIVFLFDEETCPTCRGIGRIF